MPEATPSRCSPSAATPTAPRGCRASQRSRTLSSNGPGITESNSSRASLFGRRSTTSSGNPLKSRSARASRSERRPTRPTAAAPRSPAPAQMPGPTTTHRRRRTTAGARPPPPPTGSAPPSRSETGPPVARQTCRAARSGPRTAPRVVGRAENPLAHPLADDYGVPLLTHVDLIQYAHWFGRSA